ncbi:MAG: FIST N-terminal domain-containing protein, partial [Prochlorococcaceae cyanobacterium]
MVAPFLSSWLRRPAPRAWCRTALARGASLQAAVDAACSELRGCGPADLALVFVSTSFASDLPRLLPLLQQRLQARHWLGCAGGGVVGTEATGTPRELEDEPALSVTLLSLPGADLHTFAIAATDLPDLDGPADPWLELVGRSPTAAHSMLLL